MRTTAAALLAGFVATAAADAVGRPDLAVSMVGFSQHGTTLLVSAGVRNRGSAPAPASTTGYYLARVRLGGRSVGPLRPGARLSRSTTLTVPRALPVGSYRLVVCADDRQQVSESNEGNNCRAAPRLVDVADRTPPVFTGLEAATTCIPGPAGGPARTSSYHLTWHAATDDRTPAAGIVYEIYVADAHGGENLSTPTYTTPAGAASFSTPPLPGDHAYYFVVRARDDAGNLDSNTVEQAGRNLCV